MIGARAVLALLVASLVLPCGCASDGDSRRSDGRDAWREKLRPVDELPEAHRELLLAYGRGGPEWEARRAEVVHDPVLSAFLVDNLVLEMVRAYDSSKLARRGDISGPFERARNELVALEPVSLPVMVELLAVGDGIVAYLARDVLVRMGRPAVLPVAGSLNGGDRDSRRRAAELLGELPHALEAEPDVQAALARSALEDEEWIVRAQAAGALAARAANDSDVSEAATILMRVTSDDDHAVVGRAVEGLGILGDPRAVPLLINLVERSTAEGRLDGVHRAQKALGAVTGEEPRSAADWRAWWREHRAELLGR